eukprot:evm.model.scf_3304.2 EVM.evm.TU.scf_3304.2   scf_3304:5531-14070(-)
MKVTELVGDFRTRGHLCARLDPLGRASRGPWLSEVSSVPSRISESSLQRLHLGYPFQGDDEEKVKHIAKHLQLRSRPANRKFFIGCLMPGKHRADRSQYWTLPELIEHMHHTYCGTLAVETEHVATQEQLCWLLDRMESRSPLECDIKRGILKTLVQADAFESVLAEKFPSSKRFGLEGCEAVLSGMQTIIQHSSEHGVQKIEIGIPHRGRLNILCNILGKRFGEICSEMEGQQSDFHVGDVKYHLGVSNTVHYTSEKDGMPKSVRLSVAGNPSHLEAINPVILGMVRAEQERTNDVTHRRVMGLLVHGDAAFCGLGVVAETLQLADVPGFTTGGTIHVIINNQIGFTTLPLHGRSGAHATDVVKMIGAPVLHANADDPEAVYDACKIAADWRARFGKDIVVDVVGYRRYGHNERDDPVPNLPVTYSIIQQHPSVVDIYSKKLQEEGTVPAEEVLSWKQRMQSENRKEWEAAARGQYRQSAPQFLSTNWQGEALQAHLWAGDGSHSGNPFRQEPTGLPIKTLQLVGEQSCQPPEDFQLHPQVKKMLEARRRMVASEDARVDWGMGEVLAFGALILHRGVVPANMEDKGLLESSLGASLGLNRGHYHVRLTGQDVERGTFNHRQAVMYDQVTGARCVKLNEIIPGKQDIVEVWNSPLSEAAVLGYEYGYSLGSLDRALVLWEAQFGDFANNAQVFIDQFIVSGEEKWGQKSALVLLLPHGYDGEGPDHSSARLERFLSLCNDDPDDLPGHSAAHRRQINETFEAVSRDYGGKLNRSEASELLRSMGQTKHLGEMDTELLDNLWQEMGLPENAPLTKSAWEMFMTQYLRRNAEQHTNMFVVNATTPAQLFHVLRRQVNLPYKKPLVLMTPKFLLHHRPCTSALKDFATGTFFNRVIDDGKASDNTRHLAVDPSTGKSLLHPPQKIRRVIVCSGQIYYLLWRHRRAKGLWDIVLVRLEQICPFPHDLITRIISQYREAEVVWCQEEPKNMGAWLYVKPRLDTALRELWGDKGGRIRSMRYIGRPVSASTATASFKIHQKETNEILSAALEVPTCP